MKLTAENVQRIFTACLFNEGEPTENHVKAEGILANVGFHPERLESHREEVKAMLAQLPEQFHSDKGGGWSFLQACETSEGVQWGEHINMNQLFTLGIALKLASYCLPRTMWSSLPGAMPYIVVNVA